MVQRLWMVLVGASATTIHEIGSANQRADSITNKKSKEQKEENKFCIDKRWKEQANSYKKANTRQQETISGMDVNFHY